MEVLDGTDPPLRCCTACAAEVQADELPAGLPKAIPAQRETRGTPDRCIACEQPVTMHHSRTSDVFGWWHTSCWNATAEASATYRAERDEAEGFTFRELPDARPMADALVAMPREIENTEVA